MEPRPDHGEESYRGSGKLTGCVAIDASCVTAEVLRVTGGRPVG